MNSRSTTAESNLPGEFNSADQAVDRLAIARAYVRLGATVGRRALAVEIEAHRFLHCGHAWRVYQCEKCRHQYRCRWSCMSRICELCGRRVFYRTRGRLTHLVRPYSGRRPKTYGLKFLTLTFSTDRFQGDYPSALEYKRCQAQLRRFVERFYSKFKCARSRNGGWYASTKYLGAGAIAVPELGAGKNLHFHLLVFGPYYPKEVLSKAWLDITGDSFVLLPQEVRRPGPAVHYVLKYITKPPKNRSAEALAAWAWLLKGSRRLLTYGIFYGKAGQGPQPGKVPFVCLYDGFALKYRGVGVDPDRVLLDWSEMSFYVSTRAGPWLKDYCCHIGWPARDKQYNVQEVPECQWN